MPYSVDIDRKWQKKWEDIDLARFDPEKLDRKLYILEMFSYPSAAKLHIGHWFNYSLVDSYARQKKMQGYNVFQPMGFDAFGLPAENYAIKTGIHPSDSTESNIATMEQQLKNMGGMFNWDHELATCRPEYYRWNQWLFLQLYKRGLAYRKNAPVNWCPHCNTVLANEQVMADGTCERCHTIVSKKNLTQWFFKITDYAQELLDDLEKLDWPDKTKKIQKHWIGRSEGAEIEFKAEKDGQPLLDPEGKPVSLRVFTTRADTLLGVTYVVVAPDSDLCPLLTTEEQREAVEAYCEETKKISEIDRQSTTREKTGIFTGSYAIHPITGYKVPVWVGDYVIATYGTGVVMAVPAHDERDFAFASHYHLPIKQVIAPCNGEEVQLPFCQDGRLVNSSNFDGLSSTDARHKIVASLQEKGLAHQKINFRLRDWLVSRQRYWGTPIPIIHCPHCGEVPVPEDQLPITLPYDVEFRPDGDSPLKKCESYLNTTCPVCGAKAQRDPDTLDTFVDSSWYMFRYVDPHNGSALFDSGKVNALCPVDVYVGGQEHAAMHLLYARFISKAMRDMGLVQFDEPFKRLVHQGVIMGPDGTRMSKSKGNTVSPDDYVSKYGSDVFRLTLAFSFAYTEGGPWSDGGLKAIVRFVNRIEALVDKIKNTPSSNSFAPASTLKEMCSNDTDKELLYALHYCIDQVTRDSEQFQFNTSVARLMELLNALGSYDQSEVPCLALQRAVTEQLITLLAPFAPHFSEEMAEQLGLQKDSIFRVQWPEADPEFLKRNEVEMAIQFNGKIVDRLMLPSDADAQTLIDLVKAHASFESWLKGRTVVKSIAVPGRLVNFVVK